MSDNIKSASDDFNKSIQKVLDTSQQNFIPTTYSDPVTKLLREILAELREIKGRI